MIGICECEECKLLSEIGTLTDSVNYGMWFGGKGPTVYYEYPYNDDLELAYQRGRRAGLMFRYNEIAKPIFAMR